MGNGCAPLTLNVLFESARWLAIDKPAGRLVIPGRSPSPDESIREQLARELKRPIWVVHRLDRNTSGVLVFALDEEAHRLLSFAFESGAIRKKYLALVLGRMTSEHDIEAALVPARRGRMRTARKGEEGKASRTRVRPLEVFTSTTLVEAEPLTGRTHQIRAHLLHLGFPLLVDPQYTRPASVLSEEIGGVRGGLLERTPLHASQLTIPSGPALSGALVESPLPEDFQRMLDVLRKGAI